MPEYSFKCECGRRETAIRPMSRARAKLTCVCGKQMSRDYHADMVRGGDREYHRPLVSDSLAINKDQISEHRRKFPDVEMTNEGQPVFRTYRQHDKYLKAIGFEKQPQRRVLI